MPQAVIKLFFLALLISSCSLLHRPYYQGYVEAELLYVASPTAGLLSILPIQRGQFVKKGFLLYRLDKQPEHLRLEQAEAKLIQAQNILNDLKNPKRKQEIDAIKAQINEVDATLKLAEIRLRRNTSLYEKHAIDKDSVDAAMAFYEQKKQLKSQYESNLALAQLGSRDKQISAQEAEVSSLTAHVNELAWQLAQKSRFANTDAYVFDTYFLPGEWVPAQQAVLSLLNSNEIRIEYFVPLEAVHQFKLGKKIIFHTFDNKLQGQAVVNYISPEAEYMPPLVYSRSNQDKLVFRIKAKILYPHDLKPGQPVEVEG